MSKFNVRDARTWPRGAGPVTVASHTPTITTYEGAPAYRRTVMSDLFLLGVANMVGEDTFYERAKDRDDRYRSLVHEAALADPLWTAQFLVWLRRDANMRSAPIVGAAEMVKARIDARKASLPAAGLAAADDRRGVDRAVIDLVLQRADEPGELLAYWVGRYGRRVPLAVKNGVADAVRRLYSEHSLLKYDTGSHGWRFADVIDLVHPTPRDDAQSALFEHALARRHGREELFRLGQLPVLQRRVRVSGWPLERRRQWIHDVQAGGAVAEQLRAAGMTWEALPAFIDGPLDKAAWEAIIPEMGVFALARNLRNFDDAGVSDDVAQQICERLANPAVVARSRMFPYRWLAAYEQVRSLRWAQALEKALQASLASLPALPGHTLILVDTSASMTRAALSARSKMTPVKTAAVFGIALAAKGEQVDLYGFADDTFRHPVRKGAAVIREVDAFCQRVGEVGHGTRIMDSIRASYRNHDRVIVVSDMQTMVDTHSGGWRVGPILPEGVPLYGFNLGGYHQAAFDAGGPNRYEFGGMTDATFRMIPTLESGRNGTWPWLDSHKVCPK